jgi:ribosome biogenesis SPOUT family RNA methylase Rps3
MENSFKSIINQAGSIVIFLPNKAHTDQVASALALFLALKNVKPIQIVSTSPVTVSLNRLIGIDKISEELGNKNLVLGFSDYDANGIERVSYDIIENQFKLTVIPKQGVIPPAQDQIRISYEGITADTIILFGGVTDADFPQLSTKGLEMANIYHLGTKPLTVDPSRVVYTFAQPMASISELTFYLLNEAQLPIDSDIATNLLMGIEDATQNYKSANATAETFEVTASLIRFGGRRLSGEIVDKTEYPAGSIPIPLEKPVIKEKVSKQQALKATDFADFSKNAQEPKKESVPAPLEEEQKEESEDVLNPPDDWLQPKVYRGTSLN